MLIGHTMNSASDIDKRPDLTPVSDVSSEAPVIETPSEARQGFLGRPVLLVLVVSLLLAVIAGLFVGIIRL